MYHYPQVQVGRFIDRPNRFIAHALVAGKEVTAHVKNTGRGKEVLLPLVEVALSYQPSPKRKTDYDLIAVKKGADPGFWINIDSQVPNALAADGIRSGQILLPKLKGNITLVKREVVFEDSKFDIYIETDQGEQAFVEVKGMTLENNGLGAFPDAPTLRGLKHVEGLRRAIQAGYQGYVLFIIQFEPVTSATIHQQMQPALAAAILSGQREGLTVLAYNCVVTPGTIAVKGSIPFELDQEFIDPND